MKTVDVGIIGGGPAGLATAIHAVRRGLSVKLFDSRVPPIDKACGEGFMPSGVEELERLGIPTSGKGISIFQGIRYIDGPHIADGEFRHGHGIGYRRTELHRNMVNLAESLGVQLEWGTRVTGIDPREIHTERGSITTRWIVGADGLHSQVRSWADLEQSGAGQPDRFGFCRRFKKTPWSRYVEVYWQDEAEAYVTPVGSKKVCVAITTTDHCRSFDQLLTLFPALREKLPEDTLHTRTRGSGPMDQRTTGVVRDHVALVGDAAGYRDSITGEGLSLALRQARHLASAMVRDDLKDYEKACKKINRGPFFMISLILSIQKQPRLRSKIIEHLSERSSLFSHLIEFSQGNFSLCSADIWESGILLWEIMKFVVAERIRNVPYLSAQP